MAKKLTVNQEKFAKTFVLTGNASEAYRTAYPKSLKWKEESLYSKASTMLNDVKVSARVKELQAEVKKEFNIETSRLLKEQATIALFDFRRLFDDDGRLINPIDMPDDVAAAVSSVKVSRVNRGKDDPVEESIIELKLWPKTAAIDSLFKHKGLYEKDNSQKGNALADVLRESGR